MPWGSASLTTRSWSVGDGGLPMTSERVRCAFGESQRSGNGTTRATMWDVTWLGGYREGMRDG